MKPQGLKKVAFIDKPRSQVVVFNKVAQDSSPPSGFPVQTSTTTGTVYGGVAGEYTFGFFDRTDWDIIKQMSDDMRVVDVYMLFANGVGVMVDTARLIQSDAPQFNAENGVSRGTVTISIAKPNADIYYSTNVFKAYAFQPAGDLPNDGSEYQPKRMEAGTATDFGALPVPNGSDLFQMGGLGKEAFFPFADFELLFDVEYTNASSDIVFRFRDANLSAISVELVPLSGTGATTAVIPVPAGTVALEIGSSVNSVTGMAFQKFEVNVQRI